MIRVGVDWGSSSFRAYRFDEQGALVAELSADKGIREIQPPTPAHFEKVLFDLIGDWLSDGDIVLLSGMITSRSGWVETPYLACPVDVTTIAAVAQCIDARNVQLRFLPGIKQEKPTPDVMRGEELQLLGAANTHGLSTVVLPGTHSKWAAMSGTVLSQFRTVITGELFEIILNNSLVGAIFTTDSFNENCFLVGVQLVYKTTTLVSDLFTLRSSVLLESAKSDEQHSRLSGILIGNEIREGLQLMGAVNDVVLVGSESLCSLYQIAFKSIGVTVSICTQVAAVAGFKQVAIAYEEKTQ
jgi:2-dehydro-3-deoxygalactonokinase